MVTSMTGFGRSKKETNSFFVSVEVKTVNHRFSEFYIRMPRQFNQIEDKIKKKLSSSIHRGRIEVYITVEGEGMVQRKYWSIGIYLIIMLSQSKRYSKSTFLNMDYRCGIY